MSSGTGVRNSDQFRAIPTRNEQAGIGRKLFRGWELRNQVQLLASPPGGFRRVLRDVGCVTEPRSGKTAGIGRIAATGGNSRVGGWIRLSAVQMMV